MATACTSEVLEIAETLRGTVGCINHGAQRSVPSFWAHRPQEDFPPAAIMRPEEYSGGDRLSIFCTQTTLPSREQKRLVSHWCDFLPNLMSVKFLWFISRVPQDLFDAACALPNLEGLYVKWSGIESLNRLTEAKRLTRLYIGNSASVKSLEPLGRLSKLKWLEISNIKAVTDIEVLSSLVNLEGLGYTGTENKRYTIKTFRPLSALTQLQWLHLGSVHTDDNSLRPLGTLKNLRWLGLGNFFSVEEFAWLSAHLPNAKCSWLAPFEKMHPSVFPCRKCKKNWQVMMGGKGTKRLCPTCDAVALAEHVLRFNKARAEALQGIS